MTLANRKKCPVRRIHVSRLELYLHMSVTRWGEIVPGRGHTCPGSEGLVDRAVLGSKQAAPISVSGSTGCSFEVVALCWVGGSELASPIWLVLWMGPVWVSLLFLPTAYFMNEKRIILSWSALRVWMGSYSSFVLSAVSGFSSLGPSTGIPRLRSRLLPLFLPPGPFLSLLVRPRIGSRPVEGGLGFPFL